jgi:hypothetical protein
VVAPQPVDNVLGKISFRAFIARHLRWARIRRHTSYGGYALELLTNPVLPALALVAVDPGPLSLGVLGGTVLLLSLVGYAAEWTLGVTSKPLLYPFLVLGRGVTVAVLWPVALLGSAVVWRGQRLRIGRHTLLRPDPGEPWPNPEELQSEEAPA